MNERKEMACPTCLLKPMMSVAKLFGVNVILDCQCQPVTGQSKLVGLLYRLYLAVLEMYWWFNVTNWTLKIVDRGFFCTRSIEIYGQGSFIMNCIGVFGFLFNAVLRSTFQRKKLRFLQRKSYYAAESERFRIVEKFSMGAFVVTIAILLIIKITCDLSLYPFFIKISFSPLEAAFCTVYMDMMLSLLYIELALFTIQSAGLCWLVYKRFEQLAVEFIEIEKESIDLRWRLNDLMKKHDELLHYIEDLNDRYQHIFPALYGYFILEDTLCICSVLLIPEMDTQMKMVCLGISFVLSINVMHFSYSISRFTAQIYGPFKEMEIFSSSNLLLGDKLRLLDFMKRFAKVPIGISVGGFFHVKKNFFIRLASAVESFLSSVMSLANEKPAVNCSARNSNTTSQWLA